jgi:hypothetical protein
MEMGRKEPEKGRAGEDNIFTNFTSLLNQVYAS